MNITVRKNKGYLVAALAGRFDSFGSKEFSDKLDLYLDSTIRICIIDMSEVNYLSSAGLRVLLNLSKRMNSKHGSLLLTNLQDYCNKVIDVTGFGNIFQRFDSLDEAEAYCQTIFMEEFAKSKWLELGNANTKSGKLKIIKPYSREKSSLIVQGQFSKVAFSNITEEDLVQQSFEDGGYTFGYGGLGPDAESCYPLIGNMMTLDKALVWQASDGYETPDILMPATDQVDIPFFSAYNVRFSGPFSSILFYESSDAKGASLRELCSELFSFAENRGYQECKGLLGFLMVGQNPVAIGYHLKNAPTIINSQKSHQHSIFSSANNDSWLTHSPAFSQVSSVTMGVAVKLADDLSVFDQSLLSNIYQPQAMIPPSQIEIANCFSTIFRQQQLSEKPVDLTEEAANLLNNSSDLIGVYENQPDQTTVSKALIGVFYIQDILADQKSGTAKLVREKQTTPQASKTTPVDSTSQTQDSPSPISSAPRLSAKLKSQLKNTYK